MWVRIDDAVPQHPKFLRAGREASWFWVCGNCYSSKYLTDGFIAEHALTALSPGAPHDELARLLLDAKLWERVDGGYQIHDYHDYNYRADEIQEIRRIRAESGRLGGLSKARAVANSQQDAKQSAKQDAKQSAKQNSSKKTSSNSTPSRPVPSRPIPDPNTERSEIVVSSVIEEKQELAQKHLSSADADFERFRTAYPSSRRVGGKTGKSAFKTATAGRNGTHLTAMLVALEQHKHSEQWQTPKLIPLMTTWLNQERWNQVLPEQSPMGLSPKTAGNLSALQRFANKKL